MTGVCSEKVFIVYDSSTLRELTFQSFIDIHNLNKFLEEIKKPGDSGVWLHMRLEENRRRKKDDYKIVYHLEYRFTK